MHVSKYCLGKNFSLNKAINCFIAGNPLNPTSLDVLQTRSQPTQWSWLSPAEVSHTDCNAESCFGKEEMKLRRHPRISALRPDHVHPADQKHIALPTEQGQGVR